MQFANSVKKFGLEQAMDYISKDPVKNLPKLMDWADRFSGGKFENQRKAIRKAIEDPNDPHHAMVEHIVNDTDPGVLKATMVNFFINGNLIGWDREEELRSKYGCNIPWTILMDPTSACNLRCTGCWAAEYGNKLNLTLEELDGVIRQGEALGTYVYLYSGGEPLVRKKDIITLCERHPECLFTCFTNGTLIDEDFADEMLRVKNFVPAISVEGFEKDTDFRRGEGTFAATQRAMKILREHRLLFGISCCYTSKNAEFIGSAEYFDAMIEWGAKFCWFFTYMPIGRDAVPALIATAEQREYMYHQVRKFRKEKPLFTMDFWNDGEYVGGCIAGGRSFLHINANGDIDPCAFMGAAVDQ